MDKPEIQHKPAPKDEIERKHPVHQALHLLLTHAAVQQPEIAKEAAKIKDALDDAFQPKIFNGPAAPAKGEE